jgi:lipoprotein-anchoring transpeptidase ErfK/SrfK
MSAWGIRSRLAASAVATLAVSLALTGCQQNGSNSDANAPAGDHVAANNGAAASPDSSAAPAASIVANVHAAAKNVPVDTPVKLSVKNGKLTDVTFTAHGSKKPIRGSYNTDKTAWTAGSLLEPATTYVVKSSATNTDGKVSTTRTRFTTQDLSLDQQTYATLTPLSKEVVGVGMPVIVKFDIPVKHRAAFERHMTVTSKPATQGSWHWISNQEVHWRPKSFWKSGTKVHVDVNVNGVSAGNGIYGQSNRSLNFTVGRSVIMKIDLKTDHMRVLVNHHLARTIPVTGGMPGLETRSGIKLIVEKFTSIDMDGATVGFAPGSANYYNIPNVQYAQRVTFSGEFLHAAPWSTYAQGSSNVSHGCVGMSTENAAWLFGVTHRGDPVEVTGSNRGIEPNNGWTDWDQSFKQYKQASALN